MYKLKSILSFIRSFPNEIFEIEDSYQKISKKCMFHEFFTYFQINLFLQNKKSKNFIDIDRYFKECNEFFSNVVLSEKGLISAYLYMNRQEVYIRNVNISTFIVYKENWNIYDLDKALKSKTYLKSLEN